MITEDYVSFETAKLLKEKGFGIEEETRGYYPIKGDATGRLMFGAEYHHNTSQVQIAAPTLQMAMKWLREKHKLYIGINIEVGDIQMLPSYDFEETVLGYNFVIYNEETLIWVFKDKTPRSYEKAVEAAIKYCLENLI